MQDSRAETGLSSKGKAIKGQFTKDLRTLLSPPLLSRQEGQLKTQSKRESLKIPTPRVTRQNCPAKPPYIEAHN